ncbi:TPA: hypothetical protein ACMDRF_003594 [Vibrio cholerae]|uniref:hypothetical protein n=1 Tax=Vibrio cholerae TaxID=666 RepID=UPI0012FD5731|nr:hypothetical protein [Vibrio cholerae]EGR0608758.1 hypothetical protein [Vibrio cholerae]
MMLFNDHFKRCDCPEAVDRELARITYRQPLHIVAAIRRAASSRRDQLLKEAAEREALAAEREALEKRIEEARKSCFIDDKDCDRRKLYKDPGFNGQALTLLAKAVADDTNVTHPRRWLAKHDIVRLALVAYSVKDFGDHKILVSDFREMYQQAMAALPKPKPIDSECVYYRIIH